MKYLLIFKNKTAQTLALASALIAGLPGLISLLFKLISSTE
ncbi:hypothetical protein [Nitrosospira sp. NpAV]|nr:hypothetical protein [Nitrosospira sp. NpAV]